MAKFQILLLTIFILGIKCIPLDKQKLEEIKKKCKSETGMDGSTLDAILVSEQLPEPSETYLKYIECSYKNQGFLNEKDQIVFEAINDMLDTFYPSTIVSGILEKCKIEIEREEIKVPSEKAYKAAKCIINGLHVYEESISNDI